MVLYNRNARRIQKMSRSKCHFLHCFISRSSSSKWIYIYGYTWGLRELAVRFLELSKKSCNTMFVARPVCFC